MKFLLDMNLTPDWVSIIRSGGYEAVHWSLVGNPRANDKELMAWARTHGYIVFTHDLDFGTLLATTEAEGPSVNPNTRRNSQCAKHDASGRLGPI